MSESKKALNFIDNRGTIVSDPLRVFKFRVTFKVGEGVSTPFNSAITSFSGGFQGISGLSYQVAPIPYREGGYNTTVHNVPGMTTFSPVVLTRGVLFGNDSAITWMRGLFAASSAEGFNVNDSKSNGFRCNVTVQVMDHPNEGSATNTPKMAFYLHNAWISNLSYTDLNAGANELMMESITLVHEGLSVGFTNSAGNEAAGSVKPAGF
jgi:phage tail-like protein